MASTAKILNRRTAMTALGVASLLAVSPAMAADRKESKEKGAGEDVSATEDMMREHGVLRRVLVIYAELPRLVRGSDAHIDPKALNEAAKLFRDFGENYHERMLEEDHVFPQLRKSGGENAKRVEILVRQHDRGREITRYIIDQTERGQLGDAQRLAQICQSMARMYEPHTAWEDTLVFPAWKKLHSKSELDEIAEQFEDIEHRTFGRDGFEDALRRVARVE
ncbi:MAG TPA: hemerythrin domain-containing protein, partial [Micropepsaceae bacterium]|nr:hemerythrin domain-containing protein [Micropepsaceae bacterium]